jgi:glycerol-3-phosphate dehydrogenase subunit B
VVGGGLAGAAAALELSRRGADATVVSAGPGATALSWGSLDVAGAVPGSRRLRWRAPLREAPLTGADRLAILIGTFATHPYAVLFGRDAARGDASAPADLVKSLVVELDAALAPHGLGVEGSLDENRLLADAHGALRVVDFVFTGAAGGDLAAVPEIVWVEVAGLSADPAPVVLRRLAAERAALGLAPTPARSVALRLPEGLPVDSHARLAAALDDPAAFAAFADALAALADGDGTAGRVWLLPPVLGLGPVAPKLDALRERLGGPVAETLSAVPDPTPGYRLARALDAALDAAGVKRRRGRVTGVEQREGRAAAVRVEGEGGATGRIEAHALVLATGRFLAGGLRERDGAVREPILGLPLFDARGDRVDGRPAHALVRRRYLDAHPLFSAGVTTDARLRPLSVPGGTPWLVNLHAAGEILGGFDPARDRSGLGVALVTGVLAARHALAGLPGRSALAELPERSAHEEGAR